MQVGGGQGVGVVEIGEKETEIVDDDLGGLFGCVALILGIVGQGQSEVLAVTTTDPDRLDVCQRCDLSAEFAGHVSGQPGQGIDAGCQVRGRPGVGLLEHYTVEGMVEALVGSGQGVNEHLKGHHNVRLRGGPGHIGGTVHQTPSRLYQFHWEVISRWATATPRQRAGYK